MENEWTLHVICPYRWAFYITLYRQAWEGLIEGQDLWTQLWRLACARTEAHVVLDHPEAILFSLLGNVSELLDYKNSLLNKPERNFQTHR